METDREGGLDAEERRVCDKSSDVNDVSFSQLCTEMAGRNDFLLLSFENISEPNIIG